MKRLLPVASAFALSLAALPAQAQTRVEFIGTFHLTAQSATCVSLGDATDPAFFRFRPPNLGTNGPGTKISAFYEWGGAENWTAAGSLVGNVYQPVTATGIYGGAGQMSTKMRIRSQTPATLTDTTPKVTIVGDIKSFQEDPGCDVSFTATGYLK